MTEAGKDGARSASERHPGGTARSLQSRRVTTTVTVEVPSAQVPGAPAFTVETPPSWSPRAAAGVLASFGVADRPTWSVVVSSLRVDEGTTLRDVAVRTFARQRVRHPGAAIRTQRTGRFDGRLTYLRDVVVPDRSGDQAQLQVLFELPVAGSHDLSDIVSVVATCPDGELEVLGPSVIDLVASFRPQER